MEPRLYGVITGNFTVLEHSDEEYIGRKFQEFLTQDEFNVMKGIFDKVDKEQHHSHAIQRDLNVLGRQTRGYTFGTILHLPGVQDSSWMVLWTVTEQEMLKGVPELSRFWAFLW